MVTVVKFLTSTVIFLASSYVMHAQFVDGTNGLLCMPSAEFEEDATFMITNNFLNKEYLPESGWNYNTFGYSFDITLWSRLEVAYSCVLFYGKWDPNYESLPYIFKIRLNQDRHFSARVGITKDSEWGQKWLPAISIGISDPVTGSKHDYIGSDVSGAGGNGFFNRMYIALSKKCNTVTGDIGVHFAYQYSLRTDGMATGPCAAVTWDPKWLNNDSWFMNAFRVTAEWDAINFNLGMNSNIWKDRFELMAMLYGCRYLQVGLRYKLVLSH